MNPIRRRFAFYGAVIERLSEISRLIWIVGVVVGVTLISPPIALFIAIFAVWRMSRSSTMNSTSHGSARWASVADVRAAGCVSERNGLGLGNAVGLSPLGLMARLRTLLFYPVRRSVEAIALASLGRRHPKPLLLRVPDNFAHTAVYGASGSGKSTCYAIRYLLECVENMVVLCPKGELTKLTAKMRQQFGHNVIRIDPFGVADESGIPRARINPLLLFRHDESRLVDEARRMSNAIVVRPPGESDQFWNDASVTVITAILSFLMTSAKESEGTLNRLRDIASSPVLMSQMLEVMERSDACGGLIRRLAREVAALEGKTKASVMSVTNSHLSFLDSLPVAETLSESTFDPRSLITEKVTIFLCLPVDRMTEMAPFQRVILSTLINLVFEAGEDRHRRIRFLLDEAATLGGDMTSLYSSIMFGRSFGLRMTLMFQSTSQIEICFPQSKRDDFNATVASIHCGCADLRSAKDVSEWIGQSTRFGRSEQQGRNQGASSATGIADPHHNANWGSNDSTSFNEIGRSLLRAEEVLQLPKSLAIVLLPNVRPMLVEKVPYFARTKRRVIAGLCGRLFDTWIVLVTIFVCVVIGWSLTIGRDHPLVMHIAERLPRFTM